MKFRERPSSKTAPLLRPASSLPAPEHFRGSALPHPENLRDSIAGRLCFRTNEPCSPRSILCRLHSQVKPFRSNIPNNQLPDPPPMNTSGFQIRDHPSYPSYPRSNEAYSQHRFVRPGTVQSFTVPTHPNQSKTPPIFKLTHFQILVPNRPHVPVRPVPILHPFNDSREAIPPGKFNSIKIIRSSFEVQI